MTTKKQQAADDYREVVFTTGGESPDFGVFNAGQIKKLPADVCAVLVKRGIAIYPEAIKEGAHNAE